MEALTAEEPRELGPYRMRARLRETGTARVYLAHGADGRGVSVTAARPDLAALPAFRTRFRAEAQAAERLAGPWVPPVLATGPEEWLPWLATPFTAALTLAEAVALAGPLPEPAVRTLGAALAATLERAHAVTGEAFQGLGPDVVLLTAEGPLVTAFGVLGGASAASAGEGGSLGVTVGYLTPEQVAGEKPGPAADVFMLGMLLAYAAGGAGPFDSGPADAAAHRIAHSVPDLTPVPAALRPLLGRCLAKAPGARPAPAEVAAELVPGGADPAPGAGWLPPRLTAAIAERAAQAQELPGPAVADRVPEPAAPLPAPALNGQAPPQPAWSAPQPLPVPPTRAPEPARPATNALSRLAADRRSLLTAGLAAVAGLAVGAAGVLAFDGDDGDGKAPAADSKPAARPQPVPGAPPAARWGYAVPGGKLLGTPLVQGAVLVVPGAAPTGVDLRTGKQLWTRPELAGLAQLQPAGPDPAVAFGVGPTDFTWFAVADGAIRQKVAYAQLAPGMGTPEVRAHDGTTVWFTATVGKDTALYAYDIATRTTLWRRPLGRGETFEWATAVGGRLIARRPAAAPPKGAKQVLAEFFAVDPKTGKDLWARSYGTVLPTDAAVLSPDGTLLTTAGGGLQAFDLETAKLRWQRGKGMGTYGTPLLDKGVVYAPDTTTKVAAVAAPDGREVWVGSTDLAPTTSVETRAVASASGRTVLALDPFQVTALDAASGERLWKFQDAGTLEQSADRGTYRAVAAGADAAVVWHGATLYALPVR
ncbi:PQQ-binding-like beta-propeller repeat protein [Streptomyces sp. BPTC-684]|uniref:outer membrane protein assembly factor BamB family protein n=1 Tax=Streptomyces sp. BPTC-684 TaxID=3043734 RepID=UPI0024B11BC4|nr:PQQ-binding-like beta-propeller repeat protein [Streptomyces sp. BPTC-684]WHM36658.1 PQQ-binding-like beta-propeller repeat protein [Streptomyces sp. BPTC-684]